VLDNNQLIGSHSQFITGLQIHPLGHCESGVEADLDIDDLAESSYQVRKICTITAYIEVNKYILLIYIYFT
jgi:hypothetical protein